MGCSHERRRQISEPVWVGMRVVVDVGDDLTGGNRETSVARARNTFVRAPQQRDVELLRDLSGDVARTVVYHDALEVRVVDLRVPAQTLPQGRAAVAAAAADGQT